MKSPIDCVSYRVRLVCGECMVDRTEDDPQKQIDLARLSAQA